ncbi:MAG: HNH endonuclease [Candidatus Odinarchaeota archaeon]|nr:HNH endonuclease [Candidatus Odinarchaeota archaeon]
MCWDPRYGYEPSPYKNYDKLKRIVFERDNYTCQICGYKPNIPLTIKFRYCKKCAEKGFLFKPIPGWKPPMKCKFHEKLNRCGECDYYEEIKIQLPPFEHKLPEEITITFGIPFPLVVHHIDGNKYNDNLENLITVCRSCHRRLHPKGKTLGIEEAKKKIK